MKVTICRGHLRKDVHEALAGGAAQRAEEVLKDVQRDVRLRLRFGQV